MTMKNGSGNIELTPKLLVMVIAAALVLGSTGAWGFGQILVPARAPAREEILILAGTVDNLQNIVEYNFREQEKISEKLSDMEKLLIENRIALAELKARLES
jgi:hypothetical protein